MTAFVAVVLPVEWMATGHRWLGLGDLPRTPIVEYLARSVSALYGFHGILLWIVSGDPLRYRPIVWYVASMNVVFGLVMVVIDAVAGMPLWWTIGEGPPLIAIGVLIGFLIRSLPAPIDPTGSGPVSPRAAESGSTVAPGSSRGSGMVNTPRRQATLDLRQARCPSGFARGDSVGRPCSAKSHGTQAMMIQALHADSNHVL